MVSNSTKLLCKISPAINHQASSNFKETLQQRPIIEIKSKKIIIGDECNLYTYFIIHR